MDLPPDLPIEADAVVVPTSSSSERGKRYRAWKVTWHGTPNRPMEERRECIDDIPLEHIRDTCSSVKYGIWQLERCPSTGALHWQMYFEFTKPVSFQYIQNDMRLVAAHCQRLGVRDAQGYYHKEDREDARAYCMKDKTAVFPRVKGQIGEWTEEQGRRTDVEEIKYLIEKGTPLVQVLGGCFKTAVRMMPGMKAYRAMMMQQQAQRFRNVKVRVYYGTTGTGKTLAAVEEALEQVGQNWDKVFVLTLEQGRPAWWDGYNGGKVLIIDEYYNQLHVTQLLRYLDRIPLKLEVKGDNLWALWEEVWITSNRHPLEWVTPQGNPYGPEHQAALMRRISTLTKFLPNGHRLSMNRFEQLDDN